MWPDTTEDGEGYKLLGGHRRYRAAGEAALTEIPVIVHNTSNGASLELATIDNLPREDLNPIDEANAYRRITDAGKLTRGLRRSTTVGKRRHLLGAATPRASSPTRCPTARREAAHSAKDQAPRGANAQRSPRQFGHPPLSE